MNFNRQVQSGIGLMAIIAGICLFLVLTFGTKNMAWFTSTQNLYVAEFTEIGGLFEKAPIRISGVSVGFVQSIILDPETYRAVVTVSMDKKVPIAVDSNIKVYTEGVLGSKYLSIEPGRDMSHIMASGDKFKNVESAVVLEDLIKTVVDGFINIKE